jgi:hypothetical protein
MTTPIHPPNRGLTEEAAEALALQGISLDDTSLVSGDSDEDFLDSLTDTPFPTLAASDPGIPLSDGDTIDAEVGNVGEADDNSPPSSASRSRLSRIRKDPNWEKATPREATSKPPTVDEWQKFFANVVMKMIASWYLSFAFRGIDEDLLSEREVERLALTDDERQLISVPFAELANKSKILRKHGRAIVASGDSVHALMVIGAWMARVNRIAAKYRPRQPRMQMNGVSQNGSSRQSTSQASGDAFTRGTGNGQVPNGYRVYNPGSS